VTSTAVTFTFYVLQTELLRRCLSIKSLFRYFMGRLYRTQSRRPGGRGGLHKNQSSPTRPLWCIIEAENNIIYDRGCSTTDLQKLNSLFIQNVKNSKWPPTSSGISSAHGIMQPVRYGQTRIVLLRSN
jgi:hypothetical protein